MNGEKINVPSTSNRLARMTPIAAAGFFIVAFQLGQARADIAPPNCPGDAACYKEIRIINNTDDPIYAVVQGSKQLNPALGNCPQGDTWLQRALKNTNACFPVNNTYYIYINPTLGIPKGATAAISVPWWSQPSKKGAKADQYIDWWRGGRIYIFDDQTALADSFQVNAGSKGEPVSFVAGSPLVTCAPGAHNACKSADLQIFRVKDDLLGSAIETKSPFQLNEWTFADVTDISDGGRLLSLNLNYNLILRDGSEKGVNSPV